MLTYSIASNPARSDKPKPCSTVRSFPQVHSGTRSGTKLRAFLTPLMSALAATPLLAATEFEDSIPLELAKLFLGNPGIGAATIYQDIMDGFPPFTPPAGFAVLGSLDQIYSQRVVLRTDLDSAAAKAAITEAFTAAGWQIIDFNSFRLGQQGGFIRADQPEPPQQVCHDDYGMLQISVSSSAAGQLVNLGYNDMAMRGGFGRAAGSPCDPARFGPPNIGGPGATGGVMAHMPTLLLPEAPAASSRPIAIVGGGGGGNQDDFETRMPLSSELSLADLYAHFATQVVEQGWTLDNESTGSFLATGSFTRTVEGDVELIGILSVLEAAENGFDLKFRILRKGRGTAAVGIRIYDNANGGVATRVVTEADAAQPIPIRAVSLPVPDFRPEHANERRYYVVEFAGNASNVVGGRVSSAGVLTANFPEYRGLDQALEQQPAADRHSWFYSVHQDTDQLLFTINLDDVALTALVNSLATALKTSQAEQALQGPGVRAASGAEATEQVRLKIRGDHMTLRETFDLIHQQTGCEVFREQGRLLVAVCE